MGPKPRKQKPLVMQSQLTGVYYYVTKYEELGNGKYIALDKRDATKEEIKKYQKGKTK
jgi:hypothetical protein